jgi:hypothetical protein
MLSVIMLSVIMLSALYAECRGARITSVLVVNDIGQSQLAYAGAQKLMGENLKVVWSKFSTLS